MVVLHCFCSPWTSTCVNQSPLRASTAGHPWSQHDCGIFLVIANDQSLVCLCDTRDTHPSLEKVPCPMALQLKAKAATPLSTVPRAL